MRINGARDCIIRIYGCENCYGLNGRDGTRLATVYGLLELRAIARDCFGIDPLPPFLDDTKPPSKEEEAALIAPLVTDHYGRLLVDKLIN